jgi:hypothetical protein
VRVLEVRVLAVDEDVSHGRTMPDRSAAARTARNEKGALFAGHPLHPAASGIAVRRTLLRFGAAVQRSGVTKSMLSPRGQGDEEALALVDVAESAKHSPAADRVHLDDPIEQRRPPMTSRDARTRPRMARNMIGAVEPLQGKRAA